MPTNGWLSLFDGFHPSGVMTSAAPFTLEELMGSILGISETSVASSSLQIGYAEIKSMFYYSFQMKKKYSGNTAKACLYTNSSNCRQISNHAQFFMKKRICLVNKLTQKKTKTFKKYKSSMSMLIQERFDQVIARIADMLSTFPIGINDHQFYK